MTENFVCGKIGFIPGLIWVRFKRYTDKGILEISYLRTYKADLLG